MKTIAMSFVALLVAGLACSKTGKNSSVKKGAMTIASLPRKDWPCNVKFETSGAGLDAAPDYTGAPANCRFPPDYWQPGCPVTVGRQSFEYDQQGNLTRYLEMGVATLEGIKYEGGRLISKNEGERYEEKDGAVLIVSGESTVQRVELDPQGLPLKIIDFSDGQPSGEREFFYRDGRLQRQVQTILIDTGGGQPLRQTVQTIVYGYDCG